MRKFVLAVVSLFMLAGITLGNAVPAMAAVDLVNDACTTGGTGSAVCTDHTKPINPLYGNSGVITRATKLVIRFVAIVSVFVIIVAGIQFIMAQGDSQKIINSRNTIIYAVVGLFVAVTGQALVVFVLNKL